MPPNVQQPTLPKVPKTNPGSSGQSSAGRSQSPSKPPGNFGSMQGRSNTDRFESSGSQSKAGSSPANRPQQWAANPKSGTNNSKEPTGTPQDPGKGLQSQDPKQNPKSPNGQSQDEIPQDPSGAIKDIGPKDFGQDPKENNDIGMRPILEPNGKVGDFAFDGGAGNDRVQIHDNPEQGVTVGKPSRTSPQNGGNLFVPMMKGDQQVGSVTFNGGLGGQGNGTEEVRLGNNVWKYNGVGGWYQESSQ